MKKLAVLCLIFALIGTQPALAAQETPDAAALFFDVPLRILGVGVMGVAGALFVIALPFTLSSGSFSDAWKVLIVEPFEFTFIRPLGRFDNWRVLVAEKRALPENPPVIQNVPSDNRSLENESPST